MDFIIAPVIVATLTFGFYKLFELFVRRRERMTIIEKMGDHLDPSVVENWFCSTRMLPASFSALKIGCLFVGMGLGILIGFLISAAMIPGYLTIPLQWEINEVSSMIYGASVLLCGGLGLVVAFIIELKTSGKMK